MIGAVVVLICLPVHAQDLPSLTAKLKSLRGQDRVRVAVSVEASTAAEEGKAPLKPEKLHLSITSDANGLTLVVAGEVSDTRLFREFSLFRAGELVHCGSSLAQELAGMQLVENRADSRDGVPCTRWRLQAEETRSQTGMTAKVRKTVELWIDTEGYPMAASFKKQGESKILFYKVTRESTREQRYRRLGDRLILVQDKTEEMDGDGKSKGAKRTVTTTTQIADPPGSHPHAME
jgi:hypothetical protein